MIGRLINDTISTVELNKPASANVCENDKIKIGRSDSPNPQPNQRIALTQAKSRTPFGNRV
jgi:hypothetical protein